MNKHRLSRRDFCTGIFGSGALLLGTTAALTSCGGGNENSEKTADQPATETEPALAESADPCTDFSNVDPAELEKRKALGYVEKSPIPDNLCENCKLFVPGKEGTGCGGCQLFKGPVLLDAYCTYWADPAI